MRKFDVFWIEILRKIGCVRKVPNANKQIKANVFFYDLMVCTVQKSIRKTSKKHEKCVEKVMQKTLENHQTNHSKMMQKP